MRILVTDGMDKQAMAQLREAGHEVVEQFYAPEELGAALREFDAVVVRSKTKVRANHIDEAKGGKLKLIIRGGVGVDNIDVKYAEANGITVKNTPKASSQSVAELAMGHMFSCARYLSIAGHTMREGKWEKKAYGKGIELQGKTLGIVGFGRPFTLRPTALHGWVKYTCGNITDVGTTQPPGTTIAKGDPDNGIIYFALGTWTPQEYGVCEKEDGDPLVGTDEIPICIDTRDKNTFFNPKSAAVIAYGELVFDKSVSEWQQFTIKLAYNATNRVPTHIVLVCSASRYGDYYIGSRDSKMWVDDFELVYGE